MILDTMENAKQYAGLNVNIDRVLQAMQASPLDLSPPVRISLTYWNRTGTIPAAV